VVVGSVLVVITFLTHLLGHFNLLYRSGDLRTCVCGVAAYPSCLV
jgi:hypothetical protein